MEERFLSHLRERAQARIAGGTDPDPEQLLEEARIYQVELELQYEELQETLQSLEQRSEELHQLFEQAPVAYLELTPRGQILRANMLARELFGLHEEEMHTLLRLVRSDDTDALLTFLRGKNPKPLTIGFLRQKQLWWGQLRAQRLPRDGNESVVLCAVTDVTAQQEAENALRRSEAELRRLLEMVPDAILILRGGRISYANARAHQMLRANVGGLEDQPFESMLRMDGRMRVQKWLDDNSTDPNQKRQNLEFTLCDLDGVEIQVEGRAMPTLFNKQPVILLTCRDLTERRRLEAQVAQADRLSSLGVLVAGIAHEINNPLTAIRSSLAVLSDELSTQTGHNTFGYFPKDVKRWSEMAALAQDSVKRVARIVKDLRAFSQEREVRQEPIQLNEVAIQTIRMIEPKLLGRVTLAHDLGRVPMVIGDSDRLGQVLLNLLLNAQDAMPPRSARQNRIRLRTYRQGEAVCVEVNDNGVGIPEDHLPRLFNPFFTTRRDQGGTGLGLAVSNSIIQQMGGWLEVTSQTGKGSSFIVHLPIAKGQENPTSAHRAGPDERPWLGTILLVDNEPLLRDSLARLLGYYGEVSVASSGNEAIRLLQSRSFAFILSDILMSDGDGLTLLRWIHTNRPEQLGNLVFMTGMLTAEDFQEIINTGCTVLEKPIAFAEVESAIRGLQDKERVRGTLEIRS